MRVLRGRGEMTVMGILQGGRKTGELLSTVRMVEGGGGGGYGIEELVDGGALVVDVGVVHRVHGE